VGWVSPGSPDESRLDLVNGESSVSSGSGVGAMLTGAEGISVGRSGRSKYRVYGFPVAEVTYSDPTSAQATGC